MGKISFLSYWNPTFFSSPAGTSNLYTVCLLHTSFVYPFSTLFSCVILPPLGLACSCLLLPCTTYDARYPPFSVSFSTAFSESFPELWLFLMGGLFIAVVMFFPNGLAGLWEDYGHHITNKFKPVKRLFVKATFNKTPSNKTPSNKKTAVENS